MNDVLNANFVNDVLNVVSYGLYLRFRGESCGYLNNALIGASLTVLGMGYVLYCFVKLIRVFKREWLRDGHSGRSQ